MGLHCVQWRKKSRKLSSSKQPFIVYNEPLALTLTLLGHLAHADWLWMCIYMKVIQAEKQPITKLMLFGNIIFTCLRKQHNPYHQL